MASDESQALVLYRRLDAVSGDGQAMDLDLAENGLEVWAPGWLVAIYQEVDTRLALMETLVSRHEGKRDAVETAHPGLIAEYRWLLSEQHRVFDMAMGDKDSLLRLQAEQFETLRLASNSFANHVNSILELFADAARKEFAGVWDRIDAQARDSQAIVLHMQNERLVSQEAQRALEEQFPEL